MKIRRRNHPHRQGQKSPPGSAPEGTGKGRRGQAAKIMTSATDEWFNRARELVSNRVLQAKVEEATKRNLAKAK